MIRSKFYFIVASLISFSFVSIALGGPWFTESLKLTERNGRTVGICDLNNDLKLDLILAGGLQVTVCLQSDFPYFDTSTYNRPGKSKKINGLGIHDVDRDGFLDVILGFGNYDNVPLKSTCINNGYGTSFSLEDCGNETALGVRSILFADFNKDSYYDSYTSTDPYMYYFPGNGNRLHPGTEYYNSFGPNVIDNLSLREDFWRDPSTGFFNKMPKAVIVRDFNNDNKPDIIFGGITDSTLLDYRYPEFYKTWERGIFILQNTTSSHDFSFKDVSNTNILKDGIPVTAYSAPMSVNEPPQMQVYSIVPADYDLDGDLDLFVTGINYPFAWLSIDTKSPLVRLYRNISNTHPDGEILFEDVTEHSGVDFLNRLPFDPDLKGKYGRGATILAAGVPIDINNDGFIDVVHVNRLWHEPNPEYKQCGVWLNTGRKDKIEFQFIKSADHGLTGLARDISYGDVNNDGKLDIVVADGKQVNGFGTDEFRLYCNNFQTTNNFLELVVRGPDNTFGVGYKVTLYKTGTEEVVGYDEVRTDVCYRSKRPIRLHFGLGTLTQVDLKITNRNGISIIEHNVPINQVLTRDMPI